MICVFPIINSALDEGLITVETIADMLEEDEETIQKICDAASKHAPEYDIDKIIKELIQ